MNIGLIIKSITALVLLFFVIAFGSKAWKDFQIKEDLKKQDAMFSQILDGATAKPLNLSIEYTKKTSDGSPLIFGGSQNPDIAHTETWNQLEEVGVTFLRKDFYMENTLPRNITLEEYKSDFGNMQNPNNWNQTEINKVNTVLSNAHKHKMKTMGIVSFAPAWLTYSNTPYGVPKDWNVYEDIVKKNYRMYRDNLDYLEIWNEPNYNIFLDTKNSNMSQEQAYKLILVHAVKAIRDVDAESNDGKIIPIGGPVGYDPIHTSILEAILSDSKTSNLLQFISYHNYENKHLKEPSWVNYKKVMEKYGKQNLPIFITEWNFDPDSANLNVFNTSDKAILFTGNKFLSYFRMSLPGANYHSLWPLDLSKPNKGEGTMGFYRFENGKSELLPQARTWRLMSAKMMLGKGPSNIYDIQTGDSDLNAVGFKNSANQYGAVIVNNASDSKLTTIHFKDFNLANYAKVTIYNASADNEAKEPVYTGDIKIKDHASDLVVYLPKESIVGLTLAEDSSWYDFLNLPY